MPQLAWMSYNNNALYNNKTTAFFFMFSRAYIFDLVIWIELKKIVLCMNRISLKNYTRVKMYPNSKYIHY